MLIQHCSGVVEREQNGRLDEGSFEHEAPWSAICVARCNGIQQNKSTRAAVVDVQGTWRVWPIVNTSVAAKLRVEHEG
ncbi:hypothetical protein PsYK624_105830 [Phanerochaete sordida]|uniref:Uncharacterized protein n=1 Tax=Phanerochaete sordida TaxID=48140 RepID=A0A9P3GIX4_9APHY|nr:hypothetical protein PsYK624_105830 [Phanerochaete sordida]